MRRVKDKIPSTRKIVSFIGIVIAIVFVITTMQSLLYGENFLTSKKGVKTKPVIVITSSMVPAIEVNSISIVEYCNIEDIEINDIIMYVEQARGINITHRVIDIEYNDNGEKQFLITKGDANLYEDQIKVTDDMLHGKLIKTYNSVAPILSKFMVEPGIINTATVMQSLLSLAVIIVLLAMLGYHGVGVIKAIITTSKGERYYQEVLDNYRKNIEENNNNLMELESIKENKTIKAKLAKARAVREIKAFHESTKDFNTVMKIVKYLTK